VRKTRAPGTTGEKFSVVAPNIFSTTIAYFHFSISPHAPSRRLKMTEVSGHSRYVGPKPETLVMSREFVGGT